MKLSSAIHIVTVTVALLMLYLAHSTNEKLKQLNAELKVAEAHLDRAADGAQHAQEVVDEWHRTWEFLVGRRADAEKLDREAEARLSSLEDIFIRHDLAELARSKPRLIEGLINRSSRKAMKRISCLSDIHRSDC